MGNMAFNLQKTLKKRQRDKRQERDKVLEFIQNNAAKSDFTSWLNANYEQQFKEDSDWEQIIKQVKANDAVHLNSLHNYAHTLTDEEDVNKLLKDVEKETTKAEEMVSELYDAANAKRLQPIVGGACVLGGFLLLIIAFGLLTGFLQLNIPSSLVNYIVTLSALYGGLMLFAGILLVSR